MTVVIASSRQLHNSKPTSRTHSTVVTMRYSTALHLAVFSLITTAAASQKQHPLMDPNLGPAMPIPPNSKGGPPSSGDTVILSDVLGRDRSINIFAGFTRDISTVESRLNSQHLNSTILAPINSAIMALPRKPWEDPKDYAALGAQAYEGEDGEMRAHRNLRRFVEAHIVVDSPWGAGEKVKTMGGDEVWWEEKDGHKVVQPGNIEVSSVGSNVANGEVWILKNPRNYA
jgi:hypothetical protein